MWSEQTIQKAAEEYFEKYYKYNDAVYKEDVIEIFIAGCKYILNNTQKDDNI